MVQAVINLSDDVNRVINVIKAQHGLKDKSEAVELIVNAFEDEIMEPELRPEFIQKMKEIAKEKPIPVDDFGKRYGLR